MFSDSFTYRFSWSVSDSPPAANLFPHVKNTLVSHFIAKIKQVTTNKLVLKLFEYENRIKTCEFLTSLIALAKNVLYRHLSKQKSTTQTFGVVILRLANNCIYTNWLLCHHLSQKTSFARHILLIRFSSTIKVVSISWCHLPCQHCCRQQSYTYFSTNGTTRTGRYFAFNLRPT